MASASERTASLSGVPLLIVAIGVVLFVQALFVLSYVGALHDPKPHDVASGVVGASPLPVVVGKQFSFRTTRYPSESAARDAIDGGRIDGALVARPAGATLIVVPAAGLAGATALSTAFGAAAAALHQKLDIVRAHALPPGDASGTVSFLVVMALIIGGYLSSRSGWRTVGERRGAGASPPWLSPPWSERPSRTPCTHRPFLGCVINDPFRVARESTSGPRLKPRP